MTGNPTRQAFSCAMQTDFPVTVAFSNDVLNLLNSIPSGALNDLIGATFSLDFFFNQGLDVSASSVTGARWVNQGGNCALQYTLNTTSDPVTASQIEEAILIGAGILAAAIVTGGLLAGVAPGLILLGLFITGVLAFIAVIVTAIGGIVGGIVNSPLVWIIAGAGAIGLGVVGYSLLTDKKTRQSAVRTVRGGVSRAEHYVSG